MADPQQQQQLDHDDHDQEDELRGARRVRRPDGVEQLLRLLAGNRVIVREREAAGSNEELVQGLRRSGMLSRCGSVPANAPLQAGANFVLSLVCKAQAPPQGAN